MAYIKKSLSHPSFGPFYEVILKHKLLGYNTTLLLSSVNLENEGSVILSETFTDTPKHTAFDVKKCSVLRRP
jgi:hypothetical protein